MLNVIEYGKDDYDFPALIVLGCFDAIHVGHRELLKKAKLQAKINGLDLGVMIFKEGKSGKLVSSFEERLAILEQFNVKFVVAIDYNEEFKSIAALDFLHGLEEKINVKAYMSGKDFRFGAQAKGKSSTLKNYAEDEDNGVWYMPIKDVVLNGEKVSTTLIKSCLEAGNVTKANELLGAEFSLTGEVVHGEGRGTSVVGFPTVNIEYPEWKYPLKHGVYSVKCLVDDADYQGIANFGTCPTFNDKRVALEVYLEDFSGDLYGRVLTVRFIDYIRDIEEFASAEELSDQLNADLQTANEEMAVTEPAEEVAEEVVEVVTEQPVEVAEEQQTEETVEEVVEEQPTNVTEEITEEPVEETAEEITKEPIEETVEEVVEEQPTNVTEEITEEPVEETAEEITEEPIEETAEEITEESVEEVAEEVSEEVIEDEAPLTDEVVEETPTEEVAEESDGFDEELEVAAEDIIVENEPAEEAVIEETPIEEAEELVEEQPVETADEVEEIIDEQPAEEEVVEVIDEQPIEETVEEQPIEEVTEIPEEPVEETAEETTEEPIEETAEEITEEPVEEVAEEISEEVIEDEAPLTDEVVEEAPTEEVTEQEEVTEEQTEEVEEGEQKNTEDGE